MLLKRMKRLSAEATKNANGIAGALQVCVRQGLLHLSVTQTTQAMEDVMLVPVDTIASAEWQKSACVDGFLHSFGVVLSLADSYGMKCKVCSCTDHENCHRYTFSPRENIATAMDSVERAWCNLGCMEKCTKEDDADLENAEI